MRITDAKNNLGNSVSRGPSYDRYAFRSGGNMGAELANLAGTAAATMGKLELAEEEAKADELRTEYELEYNDKVAALEEEHRNNNFQASEYQKRHQTIVSELQSKYSSAFDFNTDYGTEFKRFLDVDSRMKTQRSVGKINEIQLQNQQTSWVKGEQNRMNAAVSGDYQTLQNMITEQRTVYNTPQYQVAYGEKALIQQQSFIDQASARWIKSQLAKGSDPKEMLANMQAGEMFVGISEDTRTNVTLSLQQEVKRRDAAAKKAAKENAKLAELDALISSLTLAGGIDPKNTKHKKAFTQMLKAEVQDAQTPMQAMDRARNLRIEYSFIEQDEVSNITAAFRSNDDNKVQLALQSVEHYVRANPAMIEYFNDDIKKVSNLMRDGHSPARAVEIYQQLETMPAHRKETLQLQLKDDAFVSEPVENISDRFEELWDVDSTMGMGGWSRPEELTRVAESAYRTNYVLYNGNVKAAEAATEQFLAKNWGVTQIGGDNRIMFQSPSSYLRMRSNTEFEPEAIKEMFVEELVEFGISEEKAGRAEIYRVPSEDNKGNPQYAVLIDGQPLINKDKQYQHWTFDVDAALERFANNELDTIKAERERNESEMGLRGGLNSLNQL